MTMDGLTSAAAALGGDSADLQRRALLANQVYRLMKSGVGRPHPVSRRSPRPCCPGRQCLRQLRAGAGTEVRQDLRSLIQRSRREDLGEDAKFDPKAMPSRYPRTGRSSPAHKDLIQRICARRSTDRSVNTGKTGRRANLKNL